MKKEQAAFAQRLRRELSAKGFDSRPVALVKLLARYGNAAVTQQTISGWLNGKHLPKQDSMRALARVLGVKPHELQFGAESLREVRESQPAWPERFTGQDRLMLEEYLTLPPEQRETVRRLVAALAAAHPDRR